MSDERLTRAARPSDLGLMRTVMAADRTLMAWLRTSLSMLSFGFTIYKFLEAAAEKDALSRPNSPQQVGLFLAAMGTAAMILGLASYWLTLRELQRTEDFQINRPVLLISFVMALAGVSLFVAIATRIV